MPSLQCENDAADRLGADAGRLVLHATNENRLSFPELAIDVAVAAQFPADDKMVALWNNTLSRLVVRQASRFAEAPQGDGARLSRYAIACSLLAGMIRSEGGTPPPLPPVGMDTIPATAPIRAQEAHQQYDRAADVLGQATPTDRDAYNCIRKLAMENGKTFPWRFDTWSRYLRIFQEFNDRQKHKPRGGRSGPSVIAHDKI